MACFRSSCVNATRMTMPEASMDENADFQTGKYKIWLSRKVFPVDSIPITSRMQESSDLHFWGGILSANTGHHSGASCRVNYVHANAPRNLVANQDSANNLMRREETRNEHPLSPFEGIIDQVCSRISLASTIKSFSVISFSRTSSGYFVCSGLGTTNFTFASFISAN